MKLILMTLALVLPAIGHAEEVNVLAGRYSDCVQWTTYNGVPTSKKSEFIFGKDASLVIKISMFDGTAICDNAPVEIVEYQQFQVLDDSGNNPGRFITAKSAETNLYFKLVIAKSFALIYSSANYPVKVALVHMMHLKREL